MIHLSSACLLRVAHIQWQPRPDLFAVTVVCKATFALQPLESPLAPVQEVPHATDLFWGDAPQSSLRIAADLVPFKRHVDVLVVGHAHAPQGQPVTSLVARVAVGGMDKKIEVHGDRHWTHAGQLTEGMHFAHMPLRWERAACGLSAWNPVGVRPGGLPPNLQPVDIRLSNSADVVLPAGLGPIASSWPERTAKLHRHAATFRHEAWYERPLPEDIDGAYFNTAPLDQQIAELAPGERLLLEHLHPEYPQLITVLEEVTPMAVARRIDGREQDIRLRCDTLCIDADQGTCALVWRGSLILGSADEDVAVVVTASGRHSSEEDAEVVTLVPRAGGGATSGNILAQVPGPVRRDSGERADFVEVGVTLSPELISENAGLPFAAPVLPFSPQGEAGWTVFADPQAPCIAPPPAGASPDDGTGTMAAGLISEAVRPLPFQQSAAQPSPPAPAQVQATPTLPAPAEEHLSVALPPPLIAPLTTARGEPPRRQFPRPPPLLGSLVVTTAMESASAHDAQSEPPTARRAFETASPTPVTSPPTPAALDAPCRPHEPEVRTEDVPLDRHAVITAEIAEARAPRADVLRGHALDEPTWAAVDRRWRAALDKDGRATGRLRAAHDAAYVAAVERLRGPIGLPEYARIAVALERREANEALDALKIQRSALMPLMRLWTKKVAADGKLAAEASALLSRLRTVE